MSIHTLDLLRRNEELVQALKTAAGFMTNAAIDLETNAPKKTALATINGGLAIVRAAIKAHEGRT